jgi:phosphoglycerate dehydrogenase-like enzyme
MKKRILVTDSLFIFDSHVKRLEGAGFQVERLEKLKASEPELIAALKGVHGYILGGIENVTAPVIQAADALEAICFTGSGYSEFIPAHEEATRKGIAITAAKGANAIDVAEFTVGLMFEMIRNFPLLRSRNQAKGNSFYTARRMRGLTVGVIGYGRIGSEVARIARALGMNVLVHSRKTSGNLPAGIRFVEMSELLKNSDIVTLHVNKIHGNNVLGKSELALMKKGAILINAAFADAVDSEALLEKIKAKEIRAAFDEPAHGDFSECEIGNYNFSNGQTAFNTQEALSDTSDRCTNSIINLLTVGNDADVVNDFKKYRKS